MQTTRVEYLRTDRLTVSVVLYFRWRAGGFHDVDNRLKDVLDALQARMGGPKAVQRHPPLIQNDSQVFKVTILKMLPPPQSHGLGRVTITKHR
jgi:Holliday junction resolvase RusA-like endonuclease